MHLIDGRHYNLETQLLFCAMIYNFSCLYIVHILSLPFLSGLNTLMTIQLFHIREIKLQKLRNYGQRCSPSTNRRCLGQSMVAAFAGPNQAGKKSTYCKSNICVIVMQGLYRFRQLTAIKYHSMYCFSSRFTDSKRYEACFDRCFDLEGEIRAGEICNACVLLVKRFMKLPSGTLKNWNHVVDARSGPGIKSMVRYKPISKAIHHKIDRYSSFV